MKCGWRTHNSLMQGAHGLKFQRLGTMILHLQAAVKAVLTRGMALALPCSLVPAAAAAQRLVGAVTLSVTATP